MVLAANTSTMKSTRLRLSFGHELYFALTSFLLQVLFLFEEKISQFQRDKTYQFPGCSLCSWGKKSVCLRFFSRPSSCCISTPQSQELCPPLLALLQVPACWDFKATDIYSHQCPRFPSLINPVVMHFFFNFPIGNTRLCCFIHTVWLESLFWRITIMYIKCLVHGHLM